MKEYTYYFVDGTKNTILVEDKWYDILKGFDDEERKARYNYNRHNKQLSLVNYEGIAFADRRGNPYDELIYVAERVKVDKALASLTEKQTELFEMVFYERRKIIDIAEEQGVTQQAITDRLCRIKKKLQKFLV